MRQVKRDPFAAGMLVLVAIPTLMVVLGAVLMSYWNWRLGHILPEVGKGIGGLALRIADAIVHALGK